MNFILMQAGYPPVIIPVEERNRYYTTLKQANDGDLRPFIRFVAEHADKALQVIKFPIIHGFRLTSLNLYISNLEMYKFKGRGSIIIEKLTLCFKFIRIENFFRF